MNRKTAIIVIVLLLITVIALLLFNPTDRGTISSRWSDFAVDDTSVITRVFLVDKQNNRVDLRRTLGSDWVLNSKYSAREQSVEQLLATIQRLAIRYPVPKTAQNSVITRMAAIGVKAEVYQTKPLIQVFNTIRLFTRERKVKTFYVGDNTQDNLGTYMLMEGADHPFVVQIPGFRGFLSTRFSPLEKDWRDHTIFKTRIFEIASVNIEFPSDPGQSYSVGNIDNLSYLLQKADGSYPDFMVDTMKVLNFLTSFDHIQFEVLLDKPSDSLLMDSLRNSVPLHVITLTDRQGKVSRAVTYPKGLTEPVYDLEDNPVYVDRDRMYAIVNDGRDFVLVQYFVFNRITRPLGWFALEAE